MHSCDIPSVGALLEYANFEGAYNIDEACFGNTSWNEKTNFKGTSFENKTIKQLTAKMGCNPTPLKLKEIMKLKTSQE